MEEKKFDPYQFIGFILIALILTWMLYRNGPQETVQTQNDKQTINAPLNQAIQDSIQSQQKIKAYGDLGNFFIPNDQSNIQFTTNSMNVEIQSKGAEINTLLLELMPDGRIFSFGDEPASFAVYRRLIRRIGGRRVENSRLQK